MTTDLDKCPKGCTHETFHYCVNGTHCNKHCTCSCYMCKEERRKKS